MTPKNPTYTTSLLKRNHHHFVIMGRCVVDVTAATLVVGIWPRELQRPLETCLLQIWGTKLKRWELEKAWGKRYFISWNSIYSILLFVNGIWVTSFLELSERYALYLSNEVVPPSTRLRASNIRGRLRQTHIAKRENQRPLSRAPSRPTPHIFKQAKVQMLVDVDVHRS